MTINITPGAVLAFFLILVVGQWVYSRFDIATDDSDKDGRNRSGASVVTDHKTGLQYLRAPGGGITPRLDVDGKHMRSDFKTEGKTNEHG